VTVILTAWRRNYFFLQVPAILAQSVRPAEIIVYQNEAHLDLDPLRERFGLRVVQAKDKNYKYHGRFTLPLLFDTEFTAIFDDDAIPGPRWLENCIRCHREHGGIVGANGRIVKADGSFRTIENAPFSSDTQADFVGHCWFFRTAWIRHLWTEPQPTLHNAEDIAFCAACGIHGGLPAHVPRQDAQDRSDWANLHPALNYDATASFRQPGYIEERKRIVRFWRNRGWKTLREQG